MSPLGSQTSLCRCRCSQPAGTWAPWPVPHDDVVVGVMSCSTGPRKTHEPAADERPRAHSAATDPAEQSGTHDRAPQIWFCAARVDRHTLLTERAMVAEHREVERKYDIEPGATGRVPTPSLARHRSCVNETSSRVADIRRSHVQKVAGLCIQREGRQFELRAERAFPPNPAHRYRRMSILPRRSPT